MPQPTAPSFTDRVRKLLRKFLPSAFPTLIFVILLVLGVIMLAPGPYHDGAAGKVLCVIAGVGGGWFAWSWWRHVLEAKRLARRHRR